MAKIPEQLKNRITKIEQQIIQKKIVVKKKIAVFDLDNTLLVGDIGEAVFAALKEQEKKGAVTVEGKRIPFSWSDYQKLLKKNKKKSAYTKMVTAMSGIPLKTLINTTREVINSKENSIQLEDEKVLIPVPNKIMQAVITLLKTLEYEIFIISASNHFSVQMVAQKFFSIPESNVFGIKPKLEYYQSIQLLTSRLEKPVSIGLGKAKVYHKHINSIPPLITAGDSETDIQLLNLTDKSGISIWVGDGKMEIEVIKKRIKYPQNFFFLE